MRRFIFTNAFFCLCLHGGVAASLYCEKGIAVKKMADLKNWH